MHGRGQPIGHLVGIRMLDDDLCTAYCHREFSVSQRQNDETREKRQRRNTHWQESFIVSDWVHPIFLRRQNRQALLGRPVAGWWAGEARGTAAGFVRRLRRGCTGFARGGSNGFLSMAGGGRDGRVGSTTDGGSIGMNGDGDLVSTNSDGGGEGVFDGVWEDVFRGARGRFLK